MTPDHTFRFLTGTALVSGIAISFYYRRKADHQGGQLDPSGNHVLMVLRLMAAVALLPLLGFLVHPAWVAWARYESPSWLRWVGLFLTSVSIPGLYWLFSAIGKNISPTHATRQRHQLITDGPYRFVRHPLYTVGFLMFLGIALMATLWWLLIGLFTILLVIAWRTPIEEKNLIKEFGDDYVDYMNQTGRYFPRLRRN